MIAHGMLCLLAAVALQSPAGQSPQAEAWEKLTRLASGEWVAGGEGVPPNFHRFRYGPGQRSLWLHTRNADKPNEWPKSEGVYFWHPGEKTLKSVSVAAGDALVDAVLEWKGDRLDTSFDYYLAGRKLEYVSRWSFEGTDAYDWSLYTRTESGLAEAMQVRFTQQDKLLPLPDKALTTLKPSETLAFLDIFKGPWIVTAAGDDAPIGRLDFSWAAGGSAMLVELHGASKQAESLTRGMLYWHPELKQVRLLEIGADGEVQEGSVTQIEGGVSLDLQAFAGDGVAHLTEHWTEEPNGSFKGEKTRQVAGDSVQRSQLNLRRPE